MKILGTRININKSFWFMFGFFILPSLILLDGYLAIKMSFSFLSMYFMVLIHEYAHIFAAKKLNYQTGDININALGGIAAIDLLNVKPKDDILISFAGPISNFVLSILFYFVSLLPIESEIFKFIINYFIFINFLIGFFNLAPAYPMDGGRILRSLLLLSPLKKEAVKYSSRISLFIGLMFILLAIKTLNIFLLGISIMIMIINYNAAKIIIRSIK